MKLPEEKVREAGIAELCDVYDAITSDRAYKKGWDAAYPGNGVMAWAFRPAGVPTFCKTVGIYRVGSLVRLKSERLAVVVDQGTKSLLQPKVKAFVSTRTGARLEQRIIDLGLSSEEDAIVTFELKQDWRAISTDGLW